MLLEHGTTSFRRETIRWMAMEALCYDHFGLSEDMHFVKCIYGFDNTLRHC